MILRLRLLFDIKTTFFFYFKLKCASFFLFILRIRMKYGSPIQSWRKWWATYTMVLSSATLHSRVFNNFEEKKYFEYSACNHSSVMMIGRYLRSLFLLDRFSASFLVDMFLTFLPLFFFFLAIQVNMHLLSDFNLILIFWKA